MRKNTFKRILSATLMSAVMLSEAAVFAAGSGSITVDDCRTDSAGNLIVSGENSTQSDVFLGLCISHKDSGEIVLADQITAAAGEKFYFGGIKFKSDGTMKTGTYLVEVSDGGSIVSKKEVYNATQSQLESIFGDISADNADIKDVLQTVDGGVSYGDMLSVDMKSFENLSDTALFSAIITENKELFELPNGATNAETTEVVKSFKDVFTDALALQEYNNAKSVKEMQEWFSKYQTVDASIVGYDKRYDFSGADNANIEAVRKDMKTADESDSVGRINAQFAKLLSFDKLNADKFGTAADKSGAKTVVDYLLWQVNKNYQDASILTAVKHMPLSYARNLVLNNEAFVPFDRTDYNKISTTQDKYTAIENAMGTEYADVAALCAAIEGNCTTAASAVVDGGSNNKPTTGGGSSSGGSSGGIGAVITPAGGESEKNDSTQGGSDASKYFNDVKNMSWAVEPIDSLYRQGALNGFSDGSFKPNNNVTRAEFVKMLICSFGLESDSAECALRDVGEDDWYYKYAAIANVLGIVNGDENSNFNPGRNITREDAAVMLYRTAVKAGYILDGDGQSFTDTEYIAGYAREAVSRMSANGIINGMGNGAFSPKASCTRAQAAKMIYAVLNIAEEN